MFIHEDYLEDELLPLELQKFQNFQPKSTSWMSGPKQNFGGPIPSGLVQNFALSVRTKILAWKPMLMARAHGL